MRILHQIGWIRTFVLLILVFKAGVYLEKLSQNGYQDVLRTGLLAHMAANKIYIFKINYTAISRKSSLYTSQPEPARTTIHLTKYSTHWSSSWGNTKLEFDMYPAGSGTDWVQHWVIIPGAIYPFISNSYPVLNNIVMDCSGNHAYIDYVELAENCFSPLLIENHNFQPSPNEMPYKSSGTLKAGYNVGNPLPNGNVVVKSHASATFKAAFQIFLEPGFVAEPNSTFKTVIEPCDVNSARLIEDTVEIIDEKTIRIGDITIYDDSRETLACDDTLKIYGLDGDITSFTSYFWDFGNRITSSNPIGTVYYNEPGEYLVKLILTDSSGVTDTLSKTYTMPDCQRLKTSNPTNDIDYAHVFTIYPNPNTGQFIINFGNISGNNTIEVYDIMGKKIHSNIVLNNKTEIDISNQPKGIYLVKVLNGNSVTVQKIVYQ